MESASAEPGDAEEAGQDRRRAKVHGGRDGQQLGSWREDNRFEVHPGARLSEGVRREANHLSFQTSRQWL